MSYLIGLPHPAGSLVWTGYAFDHANWAAQQYRTVKGARIAIRAIERRLRANGRAVYLQVIGNTDVCPDFFKADDDGTDSAQWVNYCRSCRAQLATNFPAYRNPY